VLFLPDSNLGNYVKRQTGRANMKIWQGTCIVHATFPARRVAEAKAEMEATDKKITDILTPEQAQKFEKMKTDRKEKMEKKMKDGDKDKDKGAEVK